MNPKSFVVVKINKAQYKVSAGDEIEVQKIAGEKGDKVKFEEVLLAVDGDKISVGAPTVEKMVVNAEIVEQTKGPKIKTLIYKAKARFRKRKGHRQQLTKIKINSIK